MVTITYKVGATEMKDSFTFNHALSEEAFARAIMNCVSGFNQAVQSNNIITTESLETNTTTETQNVVSLSEKKGKVKKDKVVTDEPVVTINEE